MKHLFSFALLLFAVMICGCSDGHVGLSGKVTFEDGSPLATGMVCFQTDTFLARGALQPDGTYVMGSLNDDDGLPPGKYRVFISGAEKEIAPMVMEPLIEEKYTSGSTSGWEADVNASTKTLDFTVTPYVKKR